MSWKLLGPGGYCWPLITCRAPIYDAGMTPVIILLPFACLPPNFYHVDQLGQQLTKHVWFSLGLRWKYEMSACLWDTPSCRPAVPPEWCPINLVAHEDCIAQTLNSSPTPLLFSSAHKIISISGRSRISQACGKLWPSFQDLMLTVGFSSKPWPSRWHWKEMKVMSFKEFTRIYGLMIVKVPTVSNE